MSFHQTGHEDHAGGPLSTGLLNEAMESLGIAGARFAEMDGKPVLRSYYDQLGLEEFIGVLLRAITEIHLRRSNDAARLEQLESAIARLAAQDASGGPDGITARKATSLIADLRRSATEPVLTHAGQRVPTHLSIGCDD